MFEVIAYSIITSSIVVGIFSYMLKKYFLHLLSNKESSFKTVLTVNEKKHETAIKAFSEIWNVLLDIDKKIRHEMPAKLNEAVESGVTEVYFTMEKEFLLDCKYLIDKNSIFLTENLYGSVSKHFEDLLLPAYNGYINIVNQAIAGSKSLDDVNMFCETKFGTSYKKSNDNLRALFQKELKKILGNIN